MGTHWLGEDYLGPHDSYDETARAFLTNWSRGALLSR